MEDQSRINGLLVKREELQRANVELREHRMAELRKAEGPLTSRQLAERVCQVEGKDSQDRRLLTYVTRRAGCVLRKMRASRIVEGERTSAGQVWHPAERWANICG